MKKKLMIYISFSISITLLVVTVLFIAIVNFQYESNVKKQLRSNNDIIKNYFEGESENSKVTFLTHGFKTSNIRVTYIDKDGNVIYDSYAGKDKLENHNERKEVTSARKKENAYDVRVSATTGRRNIYCATKLNDETIIRSSMSVEVIKQFNREYLKYYFLGVFVVFFISLTICNRLSYIITKPVKDLDFVTSRIAKGELDRRVDISSGDEIGELGKNFNKMADKLEDNINDSFEKQTKLEAIMKSMDSGVIAIDRNFNIIMINPYAESIFNVSSEVIGKGLIEEIRNYDIEKVFKSSTCDDFEIKTVTPHDRILRIKIADIINRSEHIGRVAVLQDITDIRRLENMRSEFVANVSHELKTPLTSIKGFSETLRYVDDDKTREKFLNIINDETDRLTRLISDILTLSDIEQTKNVKKENIDVNMIIDDVESLMKNYAKSKEIEVSILGSEVPCIYGNKDRFKQMMINLVDNAIKYSENGDKVYVGTKKQNGFIKLWVEDTGVGIPKDSIPRLFERFYRVDKARSRRNGGTGLGLAIVKHIVLSFNGTIKVESQLNKGSKFIINIPY
ncbi:two-component system histidine kinase PnpS [Haloimpatiens sp. FM7315]|uniref:two-component system histidine kinase PnpS n=1 Tax=Haloimpatiens sp. FM7315 TaxID=3298609 RepID=UPI00370B10C7